MARVVIAALLLLTLTVVLEAAKMKNPLCHCSHQNKPGDSRPTIGYMITVARSKTRTWTACSDPTSAGLVCAYALNVMRPNDENGSDDDIFDELL